MLALQNVAIRAGLNPLFEGASLQVHPGQKIGLIGQNGVGKTTLFKAIMGEVPLESGQIAIPADWMIGYVQQEVGGVQAATALDFVSFGDTQYADLVRRIEQAEAAQDADALVKAHDEMDRIAGYTVPQKARQLMAGLGFSPQAIESPVSDFSGGWQVRLKLARALMQRSDLLLLDEPTNHLDIEAVAWLTQWLKHYPGAVLVISHDRDFLDQVVQGIAHIHDQKIRYYSGNFAAFERQRNEQLMQQQTLHEKQKQQMQHLKTFIERFKAKATKAKQAQSRVKALERMEQVAAVQASNPFQFQFFAPDHQPDPMVRVESVDFGYTPSRPILEDINLVLRAGDRIGLVGVNGSGKSTLIKLLVGETQPAAGKILLSKGVKIGYFAQHQLEALSLEQSPLQHMLALDAQVTDQQARDFLGRFGFSNEQSLTPVETFSGGEKARLALALMVWQKPNLIVMDEPTNHLDMETRDALDMALQDFSGALILVTHDKHLLASIADQFWWVHQGTVSLYHGDLESYLQARLNVIKQEQQAEKAQKRNDADSSANKKNVRQQNARLRKELDQRLKPLKKRFAQVEERLEKAEAALGALHEEMEDGTLYESENKARLTEVLKEQAHWEKQVELLEAEWLDLQEQIEQETETFYLECETV